MLVADRLRFRKWRERRRRDTRWRDRASRTEGSYAAALHSVLFFKSQSQIVDVGRRSDEQDDRYRPDLVWYLYLFQQYAPRQRKRYSHHINGNYK